MMDAASEARLSGGGQSPDLSRWVLWIVPGGDGPVTLALADLPACGAPRSVCTADGRSLTGPLGLTVPDPAGGAVGGSGGAHRVVLRRAARA